VRGSTGVLRGSMGGGRGAETITLRKSELSNAQDHPKATDKAALSFSLSRSYSLPLADARSGFRGLEYSSRICEPKMYGFIILLD